MREGVLIQASLLTDYCSDALPNSRATAPLTLHRLLFVGQRDSHFFQRDFVKRAGHV